MNFILKFLMLNFVPGDDLKVISERCGDDHGAIEIVPRLFFMELDERDDGLEDNEEDDGAKGVTLENTTIELEGVSGPIFGDNLPLEFGVEICDVVDEVAGDIVMIEADGDEIMADTSKSIGQIIQRNVNSFVVPLGMLNHFLNNLNVLHTAMSYYDIKSKSNGYKIIYKFI